MSLNVPICDIKVDFDLDPYDAQNKCPACKVIHLLLPFIRP